MENILQPVGGSRRPIEPHSLHAPNAAPRSDAREIVAVARGRLHGHVASYQKKKHAGLLNANSFAQSGVCSGRRQRPARRQRHGISHDPSPDARRFPGPCPWSGGRQRPASTSLGNGWPRQRGAKDHNAPPGQARERRRAEAGRGAGGAMATQPSHSHYRGRGPRL